MKVLFFLIVVVPAAHCFQQDDEQTITRTLQFTGERTSRSVLVDNTYGSIAVTAYDGDQVELTVRRRTEFEFPDDLKEANEDVRLGIREQRNRIEIVVDVPWRNRWEGVHDYGYRYYGYEVFFDFELKVPRMVDVFLRTINEGEITVNGTEGAFEVKNVNGNVTMKGMSGSGRCTTVNGSLRIDFGENPREECLFRTVNGKIEASFRDPLSADLIFKTFNGEAYTDFDVVALHNAVPEAKLRKGKRVYRAADAFAVRAGDGGPRLAFDTLNGSIYILKHQ